MAHTLHAIGYSISKLGVSMLFSGSLTLLADA